MGERINKQAVEKFYPGLFQGVLCFENIFVSLFLAKPEAPVSITLFLRKKVNSNENIHFLKFTIFRIKQVE